MAEIKSEAKREIIFKEEKVRQEKHKGTDNKERRKKMLYESQMKIRRKR